MRSTVIVDNRFLRQRTQNAKAPCSAPEFNGVRNSGALRLNSLCAFIVIRKDCARSFNIYIASERQTYRHIYFPPGNMHSLRDNLRKGAVPLTIIACIYSYMYIIIDNDRGPRTFLIMKRFSEIGDDDDKASTNHRANIQQIRALLCGVATSSTARESRLNILVNNHIVCWPVI